MKLDETVKMMNSQDFKERFKAEYLQLKIRMEGYLNVLKERAKKENIELTES